MPMLWRCCGENRLSAQDAAKIIATRNQLLVEALKLSDEREPGLSIPGDGPAAPDLAELIKRFLFAGERPKI
jgi:hypothetical protein